MKKCGFFDRLYAYEVGSIKKTKQLLRYDSIPDLHASIIMSVSFVRLDTMCRF